MTDPDFSDMATTEDVQSLVQELRMRQKELEAQNHELRQAQAMLDDQDERMVAFMKNSAVLAWIKDEQGRYVFLSENFRKRFSFSFDQIHNRTDFEIWPHDVAVRLRANDDKVLQTGKPLEVLEDVIEPDGVQTWWSSHKFPYTDSEGNRFVGGLAVDMTDRERALMEMQELNDGLERQVDLRTTEAVLRATQLEESQKYFRGVLDAVPDAIISFDSRGSITGVNQATERIFGYVSSELIGKIFNVLVPSLPIESLLCGSVDGPSFAHEQTAMRKDETAFPVDVKTNELPQQGWGVAIVRDISARKELEKQVVDSASDEQRRIGHDIHDGVGQELTGLRYMARTHAESLGSGQLNSSLADHTKIAYRMSEWLDTIQGQMRRIIRKLVPVELDQQGLVAALKGLADSTTELHHVRCVFECEQTLTVSDPGLATQLFRIVQEAVNNAVQHSQANLIQIVLEETGGTLEVRVTDDGIGIDSVPSFAPCDSKSGTGIGLNTMAYRAGLINGRLQIGSGDQAGTVVSCLVPSSRDFSNL